MTGGRGTDNGLTKACEARLRFYPGVAVWRQNTGARPIVVPGEGRRFVRFGRPGAGDLTGVGPEGVRIEIECKSGKGRLSPEQRLFRTLMQDHGAIHLVVHSVDDCVAQLDQALADRREGPPPAA